MDPLKDLSYCVERSANGVLSDISCPLQKSAGVVQGGEH